eukprot:Rhum_TRINITY_DN15265_c2_g3::Rhum_TRINITY_DN15265_c2_g3_i5::g.146592::m.146592
MSVSSGQAFQRTSTESVTQQVRQKFPTATAGEAGIPWSSTKVMTARQLNDQAVKLVGRVVVYGVRRTSAPTEPFLHYAGVLRAPEVSRADGEHFVEVSPTHNNIEGVVACGKDESFSLPTVGYDYNFVVDAIVYQTNAAKNVISRLSSDMATLQGQIAALQAQSAAPPANSILHTNTTPAPTQTPASVAQFFAPPAASSESSDDDPVFPDEATNVLQWQTVLNRDPEGLVRDLRGKYLSGVEHLPGGDWLSEAFSRLRGWCLVVSSVEDWNSNHDLVKLGNSMLQDVRLHHAFVTKGVSRQAMKYRYC